MENIQFINYSGNFNSSKFKVNTLSSPESFDDYNVNIIDLSDANNWHNMGTSTQNINNISDIKTLSAMIKKTSNKILVVLPQNISFKYNWGYVGSGKNYTQSVELKNNIPLLNLIIETLLGRHFGNSWLMYNKTKSKVQGEILTCDFIFQNISAEQSVISSTTGTSTTTINYLGLYFTTLKLQSEDNILSIIKELRWDSSSEDISPEWLNEIKILDDEELQEKYETNSQQMDYLIKEQSCLEEKMDKNNFFKSILYKTGDALVSVVNIMLKEMVGYKYEEFNDTKEEDFLFENNGVFYIGEIKGISSNVKRSNVLQAAMHKSIFLELEGNEDKEVNAIAIINRQRTIPLKERDDVTQDVEKLAKTNEVLLITAETFLSIFERFRNNKLNSQDIIELFNRKGLLVLGKKED